TVTQGALVARERRLLDQDAKAVGNLVGRFLAASLDDQGEFLAAGAGNENIAAHARLENIGDDLDDLVADGMPEAVVDALEAVDIDEDQGVEQNSPAAVEDAGDFLVEGAAVVDLRQRVGIGETLVFLELRLDAVEFGRLFAQRRRHLP